MKTVCSVYDIKAQLWSTPFFSHSAVVASRDFSAAAKGDSTIGVFPEDYELWILGSWDEETGDITPVDRVFLARGDQFIGKER